MSEYTRCHSSEMLHGKNNKSGSELKEKPQQYLLTMLRFGMVFARAPKGPLRVASLVINQQLLRKDCEPGLTYLDSCLAIDLLPLEVDGDHNR